MSVIYGTRECATIGPRTAITIAYPAPRETLLGSPVALPTSEPGTPQISYTVLAGDIPTIGGMTASDVTYTPLIYIGGHNLDSGAHSLFCRVYKNGVLVLDNSVTTDPLALWFLDAHPGSGVVAGDVLAVALWSDGVQLDYYEKALAIAATSPAAAPGGTVLLDLVFGGMSAFPTLTLADTEAGVITDSATNNNNQLFLGRIGSGGLSAGGFVVDPDAPVYQAWWGGLNTGLVIIGDNTTQFYNQMWLPTTIGFYDTSIRVTS